MAHTQVGEMDLWPGVVTDVDGRPSRRLRPWGPRLGALATAMYLTRIPDGNIALEGLGLLEMPLIWRQKSWDFSMTTSEKPTTNIEANCKEKAND